jgi:hypothetical protein
MTLTFTTFRSVLAAAVLAITAAACAANSDTSSSSDQAASSPGDKGTDPGAGGSCDDILVSGCDGATGDKLEACKADIQNAFEECLKVEACAAVRDDILEGCEPKDEACIAKADAAFYDCIGPADNTQPGK